MGLWDVFDNAVNKPVTKAYQCTYDLGRCAVQIPTVTKSVLSFSYAMGCAAVSKIDESVGNDGVKQKVKEYFPGPESRERIVQVITHPATQEAVRFVAPGGRAQAAYNLVGSLLLGNIFQKENQNDIDDEQNEYQNDIDEQNKNEHVIQQLKVMQAEIEKLQKQLNKLIMVMTSKNKRQKRA